MWLNVVYKRWIVVEIVAQRGFVLREHEARRLGMTNEPVIR